MPGMCEALNKAEEDALLVKGNTSAPVLCGLDAAILDLADALDGC